MSKEVILTGLRANSEFHIGNYLGAIVPMVQLQHDLKGQYQLNMFVPDLHSFTTPIDHTKLYRQTLDNIKVYLAAGIDITNPDTFIYRQSHIPAHAELTWILDCFAYFGELSRMTEFKEKSESQNLMIKNAPDTGYLKRSAGSLDENQLRSELLAVIEMYEILEKHRTKNLRGTENVSVGLFNYPVLMAADILLYNAKWVPVGEDQRQHLELTRDLAIRMNNKFGELFTVPNDWQKQLEFVGLERGIRIRSLRNPDKKMSKSVEDPAGTVMLTDNPDEAAEKVMSATTDSLGTIKFDWDKQPGVTNLLQILALCSNQSQDEVNKQWEGQSSYGDLKKVVAEEVKRLLVRLQSRLAEVDEHNMVAKLEEDEAKMREVAGSVLVKVQKAVGLRS